MPKRSKHNKCSNKRVNITNGKTNSRKRGKQSRNKRSSNSEEFNGRRRITSIGAGDSFYIPNFIKKSHEKHGIFVKLLQECNWQQMFHFKNTNSEMSTNVNNTYDDTSTPTIMNNRSTKALPIPRLVIGQTSKKANISALYRMPGCNQCNIPTNDYSTTVRQLMEKASVELKQTFNHCVCTLYRDENDSLGYHCDKLLDLTPNSMIISISFGAERPIIFSSLNSNHKQRIILQPGSLLAIGPKTNKMYKHSIPKLREKCLARISLSMRTIATFVVNGDGSVGGDVGNEDGICIGEHSVIVGQGKEYQTVNYPFTDNFEDKAEYSEEILQQMNEFRLRAKNQVEKIIGNNEEIDGE